jgi:putative copper export protein
MGADAVAVTERALTLLSLYLAAGTALFTVLFQRQLPSLCERARRVGGIAAICGAVLVPLQLPLTAARMAGDFAGMGDTNLLRLALHSSHGRASGWMLAGLALLAIGLFARRALNVALLGVAVVVCAPALTGHTSVHPQRALLAPLLVMHLLLGAFWLGALGPLWFAVRREPTDITAAVLQRFSKLAAWLVPCIGLAGLGMAYLLIEDWATLRRPYGLILLGKTAVFALLLALAALNRWRFTPALSVTPAAARRALQRSIVAEYLLLATALFMTAALTILFSPED